MSGRHLHRLSALRVAKEVAPGHYADGGSLYMQIADSGARSWVFRFRHDGRVRETGLGPVSRVSLGEARKLATGYREMVRVQIDPILARREQQRRQLLDISADANVPLCEQAVDIVRSALPRAKYGYLFPGCKEGCPLSNMAMLILLRRMSRPRITVHGFHGGLTSAPGIDARHGRDA